MTLTDHTLKFINSMVLKSTHYCFSEACCGQKVKMGLKKCGSVVVSYGVSTLLFRRDYESERELQYHTQWSFDMLIVTLS